MHNFGKNNGFSFCNRRDLLLNSLLFAAAGMTGCANDSSNEQDQTSTNANSGNSNVNSRQDIPFVAPQDRCAFSFDGSQLALTPGYRDFALLKIIDLEKKSGFIISPNIRGAVVGYPAFSPDGSAIAFTVQTAMKMGVGEIWVKWFNEDRLEKIKWDFPRRPKLPVFSRDSKRLAYFRGIEDLSTPNGEPLPRYANCIFEWDLAARTETRVTQVPYDSVNVLNYLPNDRDFVFSGGEPLEFVNNVIWMSTSSTHICKNCGRMALRSNDVVQDSVIRPYFEEVINGYEKTTYTVIGYAKNGSALVWFQRLWQERNYLDAKSLESYLAIHKDGKFTPINNIEISGAFAISDSGERVAKYEDALNSHNVGEKYIQIYDNAVKTDSFFISEISWQPEVIII